MPVILAYLAVVVIWSTTPLAVKWSSDGISPAMGGFLRIALAVAAAWILAWAMGLRVPWNREAVKSYLYANLGLSVGLLCVYFAAAVLPSGLISLLFGLSPIITALVSRYLLPNSELGKLQWLAVCLGVLGLAIVFKSDLMADASRYWAIVLVLIGVFGFCASTVLIKKLDLGLHPLAQTIGSLTLALPVYAVAAGILAAGSFPLEMFSETYFNPSGKAIGAILYLGIVGSLVGFVCYYFVLLKLSPTTVALTPLITPVFAVLLGAWLNHEKITSGLIMGGFCILLGLALFQWPYRRRRATLEPSTVRAEKSA